MAGARRLLRPGAEENGVGVRGEAPVCIKCDRLITRRRPSSSAAAAASSASGPGQQHGAAQSTAALWQQRAAAAQQGGGEEEEEREEEEGDDMPMALPPPMASSFVMVARMADMSMSFLHVQEAAAAAMASASSSGGGHGAQQQQQQQQQQGQWGQQGSGGRAAGLSEHLKRAECVLKYGSGQMAQLDSPACAHCLDAMEQALDRALSGLQREEGAYAVAIRGEGRGAGVAELAATRAVQEEALQALTEQLEMSEAEAAGLLAELREVARQEREHEREERAFWRRLMGHELGAVAADNVCVDLLRDVARLHARAEALAPPSSYPTSSSTGPRHANPALASLLPLSLEGGGGGGGDTRRREEEGGGEGGSRPLSVNGFRLARREAPRRELWWPEINAAWGQVVLLLNAVAHQVGFQSPRYKAVYLGTSSRILQAPGLRSQIAFPLFVARRAAPRVDEGARRVCLLAAELQRHVLALDREERRMELHVGERLMDLDLGVGGLKDEAAWATALARLVGCLRWLVRVAGTVVPQCDVMESEEEAGEGVWGGSG